MTWLDISHNQLTIAKVLLPENAKVASVTPVEKEIDDKNSVLNFRSMSASNCFSKVYENILKTTSFILHK